jgi:hypothetical protein
MQVQQAARLRFRPRDTAQHICPAPVRTAGAGGRVWWATSVGGAFFKKYENLIK